MKNHQPTLDKYIENINHIKPSGKQSTKYKHIWKQYKQSIQWSAPKLQLQELLKPKHTWYVMHAWNIYEYNMKNVYNICIYIEYLHYLHMYVYMASFN